MTAPVQAIALDPEVLERAVADALRKLGIDPTPAEAETVEPLTPEEEKAREQRAAAEMERLARIEAQAVIIATERAQHRKDAEARDAEDVGQFTPIVARTFAIIEAGRVVGYAPAVSAAVLQAAGIDAAVDVSDKESLPPLRSWYDGKTFTPPEPPRLSGPQLEMVRANALERVQQEAAAQRQQFVTPIVGQDTLDRERARELEVWPTIDAPAKQPDTFPFLNAEAMATGDTLTQVYTRVKQQRAQWLEYAARLEGARLGAVRRITEAKSVESIDAVFPIKWPAP